MRLLTPEEVLCDAEAFANAHIVNLKDDAMKVAMKHSIIAGYCNGMASGLQMTCENMDAEYKTLQSRLARAKQLLLEIDGYKFICKSGWLLLCEEWIELKNLIS